MAVVDMQVARGRRGGSASAVAIERADRERKAIALREQGFSFDEIAAELGFSDRSGARKAVERGLSRWMRETDEEFRARELERTEMIIDRLWPLIDRDDPDLKAIDRLQKLMDFRAKITGLYAKRPTVPDTYPGAPSRGAVDKGAQIKRYSELIAKITAGVRASGYGSGVAPVGDEYDDDDEVAAPTSDCGGSDGGVDDNDDELEPAVCADDKPVWDGNWIAGKFVPSDQNDPCADAKGHESKEDPDPTAAGP
jgi:hypothetical protein